MSTRVRFQALSSTPQHRIPPGPFSRIRTTLQMAGELPAAMSEWKRRYGPTFTITDVTGKMVLTAEPQLVRQLLSAPPETFDGGLPETLDVLLGERSVGLAAGDDHRWARKLISPSFCKNAISSWIDTIAELCERVFARLEPGQEFGCRSLMEELTTRVIVRIVFGASREQEQELFQSAHAVMDAIHPSFLVARQTQRSLGGLLPYARFARAVEHLDALLYRRIAQARRGGDGAPNILTALATGTDDHGAPVSDAFIRDNLYTLLVAGYETTAYALTWAAYYLAREPAVLEQLRSELATLGPAPKPQALVGLPYLGAVIDESLRIRPPAVYTARRLASTWKLGRWTLPGGVLVAPAIFLLHHDPNIWGDPERFRPSRFLERRPSPFEFLPFGGGAHRCIGAALAKTEAAVALGALVSAHGLQLREPKIDYVRTSLTCGPKQDIRMIVSEPAPARAPRPVGTVGAAVSRCPLH